MSIEKLREHTAWSRSLEALCRPLVPPMRDASFRRIVGIIVDIESNERRHTRPVFGTFVPRAYETPEGEMRVLTVEESRLVREAIVGAMDERYGPKPELPPPTSQETLRGSVRAHTELLVFTAEGLTMEDAFEDEDA